MWCRLTRVVFWGHRPWNKFRTEVQKQSIRFKGREFEVFLLELTYKEQYCFSRDFKNKSGSSVSSLGSYLITFPHLNGELTPVNLRDTFLTLQSPSSKEIGIFPSIPLEMSLLDVSQTSFLRSYFLSPEGAKHSYSELRTSHLVGLTPQISRCILKKT